VTAWAGLTVHINLKFVIKCIYYFSADVLKAVSSAAFVEENKKKMASMQEHEKVVNQYKELIQEQVRASHFYVSVRKENTLLRDALYD
jgi:hypothetical protein